VRHAAKAKRLDALHIFKFRSHTQIAHLFQELSSLCQFGFLDEETREGTYCINYVALECCRRARSSPQRMQLAIILNCVFDLLRAPTEMTGIFDLLT
jgi:hypothetical protein